MAAIQKTITLTGRSAAEIYELLARDLETWSKHSALPGIKIEPHPQEQTVRLQSQWVNANFRCFDGQIQVQAELSWMARPFRSKIEAQLDKWVQHLKQPRQPGQPQ